MTCIQKLLILASLIVFASPLASFANHGPGTTGGGSTTQSGETLKEGKLICSLDSNYTRYQSLSEQDIKERASQSGEFDSLKDAFLTNISVGYGITDDFQIEANIGWYSGRDFSDAHKEESGHTGVRSLEETEHHDSDEVNIATASPEGLSDLTIRGKYRIIKGNSGHFSLIGGLTLPVGDDSELLSDGEELEPSSQPGGGRYGAIAGVAFSRYLTSTTTIDASSLYTYRFERDDFMIGDRIDNGIALAYRLTEPSENTTQFSIFVEVLHQYIGKDEESGESNINSGGNTIFLAPGFKATFTNDIGFIVAPSFPVYQQLNGGQLETDFRMTSQIFYRF